MKKRGETVEGKRKTGNSLVGTFGKLDHKIQ